MGPGHKKTRTDTKIDPGCPMLSARSGQAPFRPRREYPRHSGRSSDSRFILLVASSRPEGQWHHATFDPGHSGGPVPDFHGVPF